MKPNLLEQLAATLQKVSLQLETISDVKRAPVFIPAVKQEDILSARVYRKIKNAKKPLGIEQPVVVPKGVHNHLGPEQIADIAVLLTKSELSVAEIAMLYNKTKPTIYSVVKKLGLKSHQASPELLAGVARRKARLALEKSGLKLNSLAPFPGAAAAASEEKAKKEASGS